jgi:putative glutamine amidotransferase
MAVGKLQPPIVGVSACLVELDTVPNHVCRANYIAALARAGCLPIVLPAIGVALAQHRLIDVLDGIVLTGSVSNVDPASYGQRPDASKTYDGARDATVLPLIGTALEAGVPLLAICRGLHELNVARGGSLFQNVHEVAGKMDHREDESQPRSIQYAPVHRVQLTRGGLLHGLYGAEEIKVSSLHWQGIDRLGEGLVIEATSDDGLVEAVRLARPDTFVVGVQWHPEWFSDDPDGIMLFREFAAACIRRRNARASDWMTRQPSRHALRVNAHWN